MTRTLGAAEAANEIRETVGATTTPPEDQHQVRYISSVCGQLGLEPTPENVHKVAMALHEHGIGVPRSQEYPKFAARSYDKAQKIVHDEVEEDSWVNEARPEPAEPAGRIVEDHPDPNLDLRNQVPSEPKPIDHPAGRASDAETNAAASQTAPPAKEEPEVYTEEVETKPGKKNKRPD